MIPLEKLNLVLSSKVTEFSEYKNYYELTNRVCFYDEANLNGVKLPYDDASLAKAQTLIDMPVQARYVVNADGEPDLGSHEVSIDEDGNLQFGTYSIGVHTAVDIKDDTVMVDGVAKTLPCLFATMKIWKRYENYCSAIKRLYDAGNLHNSWEISSFSYVYENSVKTLGDYVFEGNCLLGEGVPPAYGESAKVINMSAKNLDSETLLVASALSHDIASCADSDKDNAGKEDINLEDNENVTPEEDVNKEASVEGGTPAAPAEPIAPEEPEVTPVAEGQPEGEPAAPAEGEPAAEPEVSALTDWDLRGRVNQACREKLGKWCWCSFWFPEDHTVWCEYEGAESELDYMKFAYSVENDEVTIVGEPEAVKLTVSVTSINSEISRRDDALVSANETIKSLQDEVESMKQFKEAYEKAEAERVEAERKQKEAAIRDTAAKSGQFTKEELESEEMTKVFSELDETALKLMIAEKFMSKIPEAKSEMSSATANHTPAVRVCLETNEPEVDYLATAKKFINKR